MRHRTFVSAIGLAAFLTTASQAAEVSEQGAKDLRGLLTQGLSREIARSGFVTVKPADSRYQVSYDFSKLLDNLNWPGFSVTGLQPLMSYFEPAAKGFWNVSGDNSFDVAIHTKAGSGGPVDIEYAMASLVYSGVFDPSVGYRTLDATARDFKVAWSFGTQKADFGAAGMSYKLVSSDSAKPGAVDIATVTTMPGFYEKISGPSPEVVEMRADSFDANDKISGVPVKEVRELLHFVFQHIMAKKLSKSGTDKFHHLVTAALPLFDSLEQTDTLNNFSVHSTKGTLGLKKLTYSIKVSGLTQQSNVGLGVRAENLKLDFPAIPADYLSLVPDTAVVEAGIPDMDFAAAATILLGTDFSASKQLNEEQGRKIRDAVFPNGKLSIDIPEISATSGVYDIDASGKIVADLQQKNHYALEASILARDYDKTIAFVQNAAKTNPALNQASFAMMMAKGFAKADPDGRQRWDIKMTDDGTFTVNGQVIKAPK